MTTPGGHADGSAVEAQPTGMRFATKVQVGLLLLSTALLLAALLAAREAAEAGARDAIDQDFRRAVTSFGNLLASRVSALSDATNAAASDPRFIAQVGRTRAAEDEAGLGLGAGDDGGGGVAQEIDEAHAWFSSADLALFRRYAVLAFLDGERRRLFSKAAPERRGDSLAGLDVVDRAAERGVAMALWWSDDPRLRDAGLLPGAARPGHYLVIAEEVATRQGRLGFLVAGEPVEGGLLAELKATSQAEVALWTGGAQATTPRGLQAAVEQAIAADQGGRAPQLIDLGAVLAIAAPVPGLAGGEELGRAYLFRSLAAEIGPFQERMRIALLLVLGLALLASLPVSLLIAARLTRPIRALQDGAERVRRGDLAATVAVTGGDELGQLASTFNAMTAGLLQREQIKQTFKKYLAPTVVEDLLSNPDKLNLGGESKELSILFSDLVGFTSLSEGVTADALVALLNEYFDEVATAIVERGGTLDKFIGDSVMCFFGAPVEQPDHRTRALDAALDHLAALDRVRARWAAQGRPAIDCRIGVNTGVVVVGNLGSTHGQDYTVIGDAVNLASRLEAANKAYGTRLMVSGFTLEGQGGRFETRELDLLRVKGKAEGVRVHELLGRRGEVPPERLALRDAYEAALAQYRAGAWADALATLAQCDRLAAATGGDGPTNVLTERCRSYIDSPPPPGWDGVFTLTTK